MSTASLLCEIPHQQRYPYRYFVSQACRLYLLNRSWSTRLQILLSLSRLSSQNGIVCFHREHSCRQAVQQYVDRVDGMLDRVKGGGLPEQIKMLQASDHTIWRDTVQELYKLIGPL